MQVAVADVAVHREAAVRNAREQRCRAFQILGNSVDGHRNIVFHRAARGVALRLRYAFAQAPQLVTLRAGLGNDPVEYLAGLDAAFQQTLEHCAQQARFAGTAELDQHVVRMGLSSGSVTPSTCASTSSSDVRAISSNDVTASPLVSRLGQ